MHTLKPREDAVERNIVKLRIKRDGVINDISSTTLFSVFNIISSAFHENTLLRHFKQSTRQIEIGKKL